MGMERGLIEPMMTLPKGGEALWLVNQSSSNDKGGGGRSRIPFDENRLIQKKYPAVPVTQAEMRDCSAELDPETLKLIIASHKVILSALCIIILFDN